jgi:hypothetical protein
VRKGGKCSAASGHFVYLTHPPHDSAIAADSHVMMVDMSLWRRTALEMAPGLLEVITRAANIIDLWIRLRSELERAYETEPRDEDAIAGIYRYAVWCRTRSGNSNASTAVLLAFYEHLPTHSRVRADLPNRISENEFEQLKDQFRYFLPTHEFEAFTQEFRANAGRQSRSWKKSP